MAAAREVENLAVDTGADHVVLASDFDGVPDSACLRFWRGLQSLDGFSVAYVEDTSRAVRIVEAFYEAAETRRTIPMKDCYESQ